MQTEAANLKTYKARWADFRIDCDNLNSARRALFHAYGNEDVGADEEELWDRVWSFEDRLSHLSVAERAQRLRHDAYRYEDM